MNLENVSVARKLWVSTLLILVTMTLATVFVHRSSRSAMEDAMTAVVGYEGRITEGTTWKGLTDTNVQRVVANTLATDAAIPQVFAPRVKEGIAAITVIQKKIVEEATLPREKEALAVIAERRVTVLDLIKRLDASKQSGDTAGLGDRVDHDLMPAIGAYLGALDAFIDVEKALRDEAAASAKATTDRVEWIGRAIALLVFCASLAGVALLVRSITQPLHLAVDTAAAIAAGDLTRSLKTSRRDEFGRLMRAMDDMSSRLRGLVSNVRHGVESVSTASTQIASGNTDLSQRTEEQASNLQQTAASMEELTHTVHQNAENARAATQLATGATEVASRGGRVVGDVVTTMEAITQSSRRISDIITVIDGIAFQTNILALNAAVEAARAGEQGRGFAVVAGEVRSLAQRSATAAREIKTLIEQSVEKVDDGAALVGEAGRTMSDIVEQVQRVSDLVAEISTASVEQSRGIEQVGHAIAQLDQVTQQNAALVEESAAAAESMRQQALNLAEAVAVFNVGAAG